MSTNNCGMQKDSVAESLLERLTVYRDVGLDTDGRSHFFEPTERLIVVCKTDRRGKGVRQSDIVETIPVGEKTVVDYCQFVRDETDTEWVECSWLSVGAER